MSAYQDIPLRIARDRMISLLFQELPSLSSDGNEAFDPKQQLIPYPIRDLPIAYRSKVPNDRTMTFYILGGQKELVYTLCDDAGNPVRNNQIPNTGTFVELGADMDELLFELRSLDIFPVDSRTELSIPAEGDTEGISQFVQSWGHLIKFTTPIISEDRTFQILVQKTISTQPSVGLNQIEEFLHQSVSVRVGIDTALSVQFIPQQTSDVLSQDNRVITINFNQTILDNQPLKVQILQSQEGINYQLFEEGQDGRVERSAIVIGGTQGAAGDLDIILTPTGPFEEDTTLIVRAFRDVDNKDSQDLLLAGNLDHSVTVLVRPNPALTWTLTQDPLPFGASPDVTIHSPQLSTDYALYRYSLKESYSFEAASAEYSPAGVISPIVLAKAQDDTQAPLAELMGEVLNAGTKQSLNFPLMTDTLLLIKASKRDNGESLYLSQHVVSLNQADPGPLVEVDPPFASQGDMVQIRLRAIQSRTAYQLQEPAANSFTDIGPAQLYGADRGIGWHSNGRVLGMPIIGSAPLTGDLIVANSLQVKDDLFSRQLIEFVPIPFQQEQAYRILAIKEYSGLQLPINQSFQLRTGTLTLDGQTQQLLIQGYKGVGDGQVRSVEGWIKADHAGPLMAWGATSGNGQKFLLRLTTAGQLQLNITGSNVTGSQNVLDGKWHHVACVFDPAVAGATLKSVRLYVDGQADGQGTSANAIATASDHDVRLGNDLGTGFYQGQMAEFRLWSKALSQENIQSSMYLRINENEAHLEGYWKLNEAASPFVDISSHGRTGTFSS
ncbi:MAG: LamG domain-containing protein [Bacteroidota bacterium]